MDTELDIILCTYNDLNSFLLIDSPSSLESESFSIPALEVTTSNQCGTAVIVCGNYFRDLKTQFFEFFS